jgi:hypothetical protein
MSAQVVSVVSREDENENEVRREDQEKINRFARLNARLQEVRSEMGQAKVCLVVVAAASVLFVCARFALYY